MRRYSAIALRLGGACEFLGYHLQVLSPTTKQCSRRQHTHVLQGGISEDAIALMLLPNPASGCVFILVSGDSADLCFGPSAQLASKGTGKEITAEPPSLSHCREVKSS